MHVFRWTVILQRKVFSDATARIYARVGCIDNGRSLKAVERKWKSPVGETSQAYCIGVT